MLLSSIIYENEERDVAVINIPNFFIQTRIDNEKDMDIINIRNILVDMLQYISLDVYGPYVTTDRKGIKQLITLCINDIYGTMVASLLYYFKFCKTLKFNKFRLNPYDPCVANRLINGLKQSILFHVYDFKLSQKYPKVNYSFFGVTREEY